jgi:hypothetical protein
MQTGVAHQRKPRGIRNCIALRVYVPSFLQRTLHHEAHQQLGNEDQEERADDLHHTKAQFEPDRERHPDRAGERRSDQHAYDGDRLGLCRQLQCHPGGCDRTSVKLTFSADIERAGSKGDGDA